MKVKRTIRALRVEKGWTLRDLSARCGLDVSTLSRIENLKYAPSEEEKIRIARAFEVEMDQIAFPEIMLSRGVIDTDVRRVRIRGKAAKEENDEGDKDRNRVDG